jgi:hypothetical protein
VKALFRRGKAKNSLNDLDGAKEDLLAAAKLDPANKDIRTELESVNRKLKAFRAKERELYAKVVEKTFGTSESNKSQESGMEREEKGNKS